MAARRNTIRQIAKVIWSIEQKFVSRDAGAVSADFVEATEMISRSIMRAGLSKKMDLIKKEYERLRDAASGTIRVRAVSARELPTTVRGEAEAQIVKLFEASSVATEWSVDPALVGGLRVEANDYEVRSSVADMLKQL